MSSFHCNAEEWFPMLQLVDVQLFGIEPANFTDEEVARINTAKAEFVACQRLIAERFGIAQPASWWT